MELSKKISVYLISVVALATVHAGLAIATSWRFRADVEQVANEHLPSIRAAEELEIALLEQRGYVASHLLAEGRGAWLEELSRRGMAFDRWLTEAKRTSHTVVEWELIHELERLYADYVFTRDRVIATYQGGDLATAKKMLLEELPKKYDAAYAICERFIDLNNQYADAVVADARYHVQVQIWLTASTVASSVLFGLFAMFTFQKRVLVPVRQLTQELRWQQTQQTQVENADKPMPLGADVVSAEQTDEFQALGQGLRQLMSDVAATRISLRSRQRELKDAERLASVGKLAASVAHEIRNPLTAIKVWLFTLKRSLVGQTELTRSFDQIADELQRLENVVRSFLEFSRPPDPHPKAEQLSVLVAKAVELVRHRMREQAVEIAMDCPEELPAAWIDPDHFRQVLLNLLNNALDAMPSGGVIKIDVGVSERAGRRLLRVAVRDFGEGMSDESQRRLFEPFYTSKPNGTGLGLAIAASIMASQEGAVTLESTNADGTEFAVWVAIADPQMKG